LPEGAALSETERTAMLRGLELMQAHIAECGELFGAMGRISVEEQQALYRDLLTLREQAPRWTEVAAKRR